MFPHKTIIGQSKHY